jgi:hypothetical protein
MSDRRRPSAFRGLGDVDIDSLGVSPARGAELRAARSWRRIAGGLAGRFPPRVRRGVLEISAPDAAWERTLASFLPGLAARLARAEPQLGIRSWRLDGPGGRGRPTAIDPADAGELPVAAAPTPEPAPGAVDTLAPARPEGEPSVECGDLVERLARVRDAYLGRGVRESGGAATRRARTERAPRSTGPGRP